jgi:hypothetical protein
MDFWVHNTLKGYIIEFSVENHQSFSKAKALFYEGARGILVDEDLVGGRRNATDSFG